MRKFNPWFVALLGSVCLLLLSAPAFAHATSNAFPDGPTPAPEKACELHIAAGTTPDEAPVNIPWIRIPSLEVWEDVRLLPAQQNYFITVSDLPITLENVLKVYSAGGKLYQHFDRVDAAGNVEEHRWEFPFRRGINKMPRVEEVFRRTDLLKRLYHTMYPHKIADPKNKRNILRDEARPAYLIRFSYEPAKLIHACATAERLKQNTTTKEKHIGADGRSILTTETWLSEQVQRVFLEMVEQGLGYTVEVYTTEHHPKEILDGTHGGKLVAGALGIIVNGSYTGITLFMDRSHPEGLRNKQYYDNAGRLAFFGEIDYLHSLDIQWIDSVVLNSAAQELGGEWVSRADFHHLRASAVHRHQHKFVPIDNKTWHVRFVRWDKRHLQQ